MSDEAVFFGVCGMASIAVGMSFRGWVGFVVGMFGAILLGCALLIFFLCDDPFGASRGGH